MKKRDYIVISICIVIVSISSVGFFFYKGEKNKFDFTTSSKSSFSFDSKEGSYWVIYGTVGKGIYAKPQPMVIYLGSKSLVSNVASGWGYENQDVFGVVTINGRQHKIPLTCVVLVNPQNDSYKIISNYWNPSLFRSENKTECFVKRLLKL